VLIQAHCNTPSYRTEHTGTQNRAQESYPEGGAGTCERHIRQNCMKGRSNTVIECSSAYGITRMPLRIHTTLSLDTQACKSTTNWCRSFDTTDSMKECSRGNSRNLQFLPDQWCEQKYAYTCQCLALLNAEQWPVRQQAVGRTIQLPSLPQRLKFRHTPASLICQYTTSKSSTNDPFPSVFTFVSYSKFPGF
jgi:hypothetical protein